MSVFLPFINLRFSSGTDPEATFTSSTYVSDNKDNIDWKTLRSDEFNLDMRAYVRTLDTEVPHGTEPIEIVFDVLDSQIKNERNCVKSRRIGVIATEASTVVDKVLNGSWDELQRFADSYTVTKTRQANTTLTATGLLTVNQQLKEHNPANWLSDVITVAAWSTRNKHVVDDELGMTVTITESVVAHGTSVSANTTTTFYEQRQVDSQRDILTTTVLSSAFDRTTYEPVNYTFPSLFVGYTTSTGFIESQRRSYFSLSPAIRSAFTAPVYARVVEKLYTATEQAVLVASTPGIGSDSVRELLWEMKPVDVVYSGYLFSLNISKVLINSQSITATTNSNDTYYGSSVTDTLTIGGSTPDYTAYAAAIGSEKCIEDFCKPWKYGLFWRRRTYIKLQ